MYLGQLYEYIVYFNDRIVNNFCNYTSIHCILTLEHLQETPTFTLKNNIKNGS